MASAATPDYQTMSDAKLVDTLTGIDEAAPGAVDMAGFDSFIAEDGPVQMRMGIIGAPPPAIPPAMRELVRRGAAALPTLVEHLDDRRPTKLVVGASVFAKGGGFFMWTRFSSEYDPRVGVVHLAEATPKVGEHTLPPDGYTVTVGDLCYVLIGQIVNRNLTAVRYQPTAGVIVNSPIQSPELRAATAKDWSGVTAAQLRASLLADIALTPDPNRGPLRTDGALRRLRFYFPKAYAGLRGDGLAKRIRFEADEKAERARLQAP